MEEIMDVEKWLEEYKPPEVEYSAAFDPQTGSVTKVGPARALINEPHKASIDQEVAEKILQGKIPLHHCYVDLDSHTVEIAEVRSIFKISDILHRIIGIEYSTSDKHDIYIVYNRSEKTLTVNLIDDFNQFMEVTDGTTPNKKKRIHWNGDTAMDLYITDYNDPNILHKILKLHVSDLVDVSKVFYDIDLPERFSIYTKRIFKNYAVEIK